MAASHFKFFQFLFCFLAEMSGHIYLHSHILVAMNRRILHGNDPLSSQTDPGAGLCPFPDLADHISIEGCYQSFPAKHCGRKWYMHGRIYIHALSFIPCFFKTCTSKSRSPGSPPPLPGIPFPRSRTLFPVSMPAGIWTCKVWGVPAES